MRPRLVALAVAAALAPGCATDPRPAGPPAAGEAVNEQIRLARAVLGQPMADLATALVDTAAALDSARHEVPRGRRMQAAVDAVTGDVAALRGAAEVAAGAVNALTDDPRTGGAAEVTGALRLVGEAVDRGHAAAGAAEAEAVFLRALADADVRMDDSVSQWDSAGSQTQLRELLARLSAELDTLAAQLAGVAAVPAECPGLRDARVRWADVAAGRTRELAAHAVGSGGQTYDELRAAFRPLPYGEDRLAADAADRTCWRQHSAVAQAAVAARHTVDQLEALLER